MTITQTSGSANVDTSIIPYMRAREVEFSADNLRPQRRAFCFFGPTNITRFVQPASVLVPDTANANITKGTVIGERLYCNTTHRFATVIDNSMGNTIYINENYVTLNISQVGANNSWSYNVGDIVYQASNSAVPVPDDATFEAQVVYFNSASGVLALQPITGTVNVNSTNSSNTTAWLYQSGRDQLVSANTVVIGNGFPVNAVVSSLDNVANRFLVNTYGHNMGVCANTQNAPNANCVTLSGPPPSDLVGNLIYITAATGLGQIAQVLSVNGQVAYCNVAFNPQPTGNSYYGLGNLTVDAVGKLVGVFNIPETQTVNFLTGQQTFSISDSIVVDDPDSTMQAAANYVSQGYIGAGTNTPATPVIQPSIHGSSATSGASASDPISGVQNQITVIASPGPNTTYSGVLSQLAANASANMIYNGVNLSQIAGTFAVSPISQSFTTPQPSSQNTNLGIFVSSIDLWFNTGPSGSSPHFPVLLSIVETVNGVPTSNVVATASVPYSDIKYSTIPDSVNIGALSINNTTVTRFVFDDPVYLQPATTYALTLYTESPDYEVYVAKVGDTDISTGGATHSKRVSSLPSVDNFFTSQNASAWTPVPNQMLMFVLNQAVFSTSPVSATFVMNPITGLTAYDEIILSSSDLNFAPCSLTYKILPLLANTWAPDTSYTQVVPNKPWYFGQDLKVSSLNGTRRRIILPGNSSSLLAQISMQTQNPYVSPVFNAERLAATLVTNDINYGQIDQELITITNGGNHMNAANIIVTISAPDLANGQITNGIQATANVMFLSGNAVTVVTVTNPGAGYTKAPTITISEPGAPANATAVVAGEDQSSGGNAISRYITRPINLASGMAAGDLRVWLSAIVPNGTNVLAYYKVLGTTDTEPLANVPWVQMALVSGNNVSPDQSTPVALEFCPALGPNGLPSGTLNYTLNGVQYPLGGKFVTFAIKLVLLADDPSVPPVVQSFQCAAYPSG